MTGAAGWAASGSLLDGVARAADTAPCTPTAPGTRTSAIALAPGARSAWTADAGATTISRVRVRDLVRGPARDVGGSPLALTLTPDGRTALVLTAAHDRPGLVLVDLTGTATDRVDVGAAPRALAVTADGRHAWVAGEEGLLRVTLADGAFDGPIALGGRPRAVALLPDGRRAAVTDHTGAALLLVDLRRRRVLRRIATSPFPSELALAARGTRALVTHDAYGATGVTLVDLVRGRALRTLRTGADPAGVAVDARGTVALVANAGDGTVSVLDLRSGRHRRRARPGGAPRAVAVAGRRGIAVDGDTGLLTAVPLTKGPR